IPFDDPDDLVHPRSILGIAGSEGRVDEDFIQIPNDRLRLVDAKAVMLENGDSPERVKLEMFWGFHVRRGHRPQVIRDVLLLERNLDAAEEWAPGNSMDCDVGHRMSPSSCELRRRRVAGARASRQDR